MKDYLIPIAIVVGAIIISATTYIAVTDHDRKAYQHCLEAKEERGWSNINCKDYIYKQMKIPNIGFIPALFFWGVVGFIIAFLDIKSDWVYFVWFMSYFVYVGAVVI